MICLSMYKYDIINGKSDVVNDVVSDVVSNTYIAALNVSEQAVLTKIT